MKTVASRSFSRIASPWALAVLLPLLIALSGCGGSSSLSSTAPTSATPTVTIAASPASITAGSSATLTVTATNASGVAVSGSDGSSYTLSVNGGTQAVSPSATTTYTATATGTSGSASGKATVTVTAAPPPPAPTVTLSASPTTITAGSSSTLTVAATNATAVTVTGTDGSSYTLKASGGTQAVSPAATTTYTASATGAGGTVTATAMVTVTAPTGPATVVITATPATIVEGSSSTLAVTATNATAVTVTGSDGSSYALSGSGGTQVVSPSATTTYTAKATGADGNASAKAQVTVTPAPKPTVTIVANPASVTTGNSSTLTVVATNATGVTVTGTDSSSYTLGATGGTQVVSPTATATYTATATGLGGSATATATVSVVQPGAEQINHVIFMLQENRTFDTYFGMLNPYRAANGWNVGDDGKTYNVDGIDDKLNTISNDDDAGNVYSLFKFKTTCIDDESSAWLSSYGDVNRWVFATSRKIKMDGFVHTTEGFTTSCIASGTCSGAYTDTAGERSMGYYDQDFLNYYYYMASQYAVSDRWFSPIASKSTPNRVATYSGGTTQGLVYDPGYNDHIGGITAPPIFEALDKAGVSWKVYYSLTQGQCNDPEDCSGGASSYPATDLGYLYYDDKYLYVNTTHAACQAPTVPSSQVGDSTNYYCVDPNHVAPLKQYFADLTNGTLPSFAFIEPGYGLNDEHPASFEPILLGQAQMATIINAFIGSPSYKDSVFFFSYDEGGGPYDHVPPVPGHSNDNTDKSLGTIPDISTIAVNADSYWPCPEVSGQPITHCDLHSSDPGVNPTDAPAVEGFAAQLGFRLPNIVISPFTRRHYVSHIPMDHTAIMKFVENRFIGPSAHLTARDEIQPNLLDFFDFTNVPWATPPTPPAPVTTQILGYNSCTPTTLGP